MIISNLPVKFTTSLVESVHTRTFIRPHPSTLTVFTVPPNSEPQQNAMSFKDLDGPRSHVLLFVKFGK